jgi:hypothetical protein
LRFRSRVGNATTVIKDWTEAEIPGGIPTSAGWHHLAVEVEGNQFRFFFNGNELPGGPYTDDTFSNGWIGAYVWDQLVSPCSLFIDDIYVISTTTGIQDTRSGLISCYDLYQNYPNPFNPLTKIKYQIPEKSFVALKVFDALGNEVMTLVNEEKVVGNYQVEFNAVGLPSGVYFYRIKAGDFLETKKMVLIK